MPTPTLEEIRADITDIVHRVACLPVEDIDPDRDLMNDLDIDSLSMVEITVTAEDRYGVKLPDDTLDDLPTLNHVAAYIHGELA
ncbi:acyl carrier protein [Streptosporangium sp. NPDC048865]|uniref:acyl carrier protein n=1 Tax=Streptosporangium sp. NPDC048865 TaxID=3155766 RepID=UPI003415FFD0